MEINFKEFYSDLDIKKIIDKINGGAKNSKLSPSDKETILSVLKCGEIRRIMIQLPDKITAKNSSQQAFTDLMISLCTNEDYFQKMKKAGWLYEEQDIKETSNISKRYGLIRDGFYVFKDAEVTFLMARSIKAVLETRGEEALLGYTFKCELKKDDSSDADIVSDVEPHISDIWLPALTDYSPNISKEQWSTLLSNPEIFTPKNLLAMACLYDNGGEGSCSELATKYNQSMTLWRTSCGVHLAGRIAEATKCHVLTQDDKKIYYVIPFLYRKAEMDETGSYIYKLRPELEAALKDFNILKYLPQSEKVSMTIKESIEYIKTYIAGSGFTYEDGLIENFFLSLKSKPFVILAGTSGTGKTRLVKLFAEAIGAEYQLVSVRPDWSDGSDLFGHYDLNGHFVDGPVCECFRMAYDKPYKPVFLCLDEMNLARVEYYLSDFLSVIESREKVADGKVVTPPIAQYEKGIPDNLYIVGTVNMDETTFPFSKKVLDRANTIEFSYVDLIPSFDVVDTQPEKLQLPNSFLRTEYLVLTKDCAEEQEFVRDICAELQAINEILVKANAHVGYRVRDEIIFYMLNNKVEGELITHNEAFDNEIMQKILPRIQGSSASVRDMLCDLFKICAADQNQKTGDTDSEKMRKVLSDESIDCKYRKSAEKLELMVRRFEEDGFTSYWL